MIGIDFLRFATEVLRAALERTDPKFSEAMRAANAKPVQDSHEIIERGTGECRDLSDCSKR